MARSPYTPASCWGRRTARVRLLLLPPLARLCSCNRASRACGLSCSTHLAFQPLSTLLSCASVKHFDQPVRLRFLQQGIASLLSRLLTSSAGCAELPSRAVRSSRPSFLLCFRIQSALIAFRPASALSVSRVSAICARGRKWMLSPMLQPQLNWCDIIFPILSKRFSRAASVLTVQELWPPS